MSKSTELSKAAKAYIIECIDNSGYSDTPLESESEKVQFLKADFYETHGWQVARIGEVATLIEYFQGLPSTCNIEYRNYEILKLAVKWGSLPSHATESQKDKILGNWWNFIANKTAQLFRAYPA